ncbi:hypothetical protein GMST_35120 [Geomonas silvestris]|uniref:Uncharacterized protein n=1 Tax=Geomonas silvestris TaxID=2740184 RepID=A0A6V8MMU1_9BACT|nr:hypothetical protein [Geomonas silvestris]GFO61187.1 hypothetical protein GMST_35120 [Geomonas silvestris]
MDGKKAGVDIEALESEIIEALQPCANALGWNGPAFYMLAQEVAEMGKVIGDVTLAELAQLCDQAGERYDRMCERLRT